MEYALPFGFLGRWLAGKFVRRKLERLFEHRHAIAARAVPGAEQGIDGNGARFSVLPGSEEQNGVFSAACSACEMW